jgi:hypothetical protein
MWWCGWVTVTVVVFVAMRDARTGLELNRRQLMTSGMPENLG